MNCQKCHKSDDVVTRPDGTKYCLDCGERVEPAPLDAAACSVKIELRYNGDYPGYACIRINDRWATDKEAAALVTIFGQEGSNISTTWLEQSAATKSINRGMAL